MSYQRGVTFGGFSFRTNRRIAFSVSFSAVSSSGDTISFLLHEDFQVVYIVFHVLLADTSSSWLWLEQSSTFEGSQADRPAPSPPRSGYSTVLRQPNSTRTCSADRWELPPTWPSWYFWRTSVAMDPVFFLLRRQSRPTLSPPAASTSSRAGAAKRRPCWTYLRRWSSSTAPRSAATPTLVIITTRGWY